MAHPLLLGMGAPLFLAGTFAAGRAALARRHKILTPPGIQAAGYVPLGGIHQYLRLRGRGRTNPVILVLHGGPGSPMAGDAYRWQPLLEGAYTFVHWDQRGCANTYYRNPGGVKPTLELLLADLDGLVDYLRAALGCEKILLLGHSWGTFLGAVYVGRHPGKVSAYIAVSQMVDFLQSERISTREAARRARAAGRPGAAREMEAQLEDICACCATGQA